MEVNELLQTDSQQHLGMAKYNASWDFNMHLMSLIRAGDMSSIRENPKDWHKSLVALYRSTNAYMSEQEREEAKRLYEAANKSTIAFDVYLRNWTNAWNKGDQILFEPPKAIANSLHEFDMFLKQVLKDHNLLTPTMRGTTADAMRE